MIDNAIVFLAWLVVTLAFIALTTSLAERIIQ